MEVWLMLDLYKNIKSRRLELGMTQTDLARELGYADKSMVAKIEKGLVDLTQSKIIAFASALKTTPSELMGWDDVPERKNPEPTYEDVELLIARNGKKMSKEQKLKLIQMLSEIN